MTREEIMNRMAENRKQAEDGVAAYNTALMTENFKAQKDARAVVDKAVADYAADAKLLALDFCEKSPDPMVAAITMLKYQVIAAKDTKVGEGSAATVVLQIVDRDKYVPLKELHKRVSGGIGADKNWLYILENFNMRLTAKYAQDIGCPPEKITEIYNCFAMAEFSKSIQLGKNPFSKNQIVNAMQRLVTAMVGDSYKVQAKDVDWLMAVYAKHGKAELSIACANNTKLTQYVAEVCHAIILNKDYGIEYKLAKKK